MRLKPSDPRFALGTDAAAIAGILPEHLDGTIPRVNWDDLTVTKALPHRRVGFVIQYTVPYETGGLLYLGGHLTGGGANRPAWAGVVPGTAWLSDPGLAVAIPSADPKLKGMERVLDGNWAEDLVAKMGWKGGLTSVPETLAYRIEKRYVFRLRSDHGESAVIKVVRPRKLDAMASAHLETLKSLPAVVPGVLQVDPSVGALVMEDVPGVPLNEVGFSSAPGAYAAAGELLRSYHQPQSGGAERRTVTDELIQLGEWIGVASRLHPELADAYREAFKQLAAGPPAGDVASVRLHRDFYDKQIMVDQDRVTLLDLDTATCGDPALDVGNFLAHIMLRQRQSEDAESLPDIATRAFLDSYHAGEEIIPWISWWRTAALLRLATIYSFRPRWWHLTPELLEDVDACLRKPELLS